MLTAKTETQAGTGLGQRVQEIFQLPGGALGSERTQEERARTLARVGRWAGVIGAAVAEAAAKGLTAVPASSPAAARAAFEQWIERAGLKSDRPVAVLGRVADVAADAIAELIAGRVVPTGTLIAAAVAGKAEQPDVPAASPLAQSAAQIREVLERIAARRVARGERPPPGAHSEPSGIGSEPAAGGDGRATLDHAGARVSGLRRLANAGGRRRQGGRVRRRRRAGRSDPARVERFRSQFGHLAGD